MDKSEINLSLIDLKNLSEPVCKLIEAVSSAVGIVYEPTRIRRKAKAEAAAIVLLAEGKGKVDKLAFRAAERIKNRELQRQRNIEAIVKGAIEHLPPKVSKEQSDPDWIAQFFNQCEDVSDEQMQSLWSKLLAGEVTQPGTYSIRTIDLVRVLHKNDAELFTRVCTYFWREETGSAYYFRADEIDRYLRSKGIIFFNDFLQLRGLGLLEVGPNLTLSLLKNKQELFEYHGKTYILTLTENLENFEQPIFLLSDIGAELHRICGARPDEEYRGLVVNVLAKNGVLLKPRS